MNWLLCTAVGAAAGLLASMGLGGGFVLVVFLALATDLPQRAVQGINLLFFLPVVLLSGALHCRNKLADARLALYCAAFGTAAAAGGFYLGRALPQPALRTVFALFLLAAGARDLFVPQPQKKIDKP